MSGRAKLVGLVCVLGLLLAAVDQVVKTIVTRELGHGASHPVISGIFELTYSENRGAAFGMMRDAPSLVLVAHIAVLGIFVLLVWPHLHKRAGAVAAVLVLGGAIGNLIDRVRLQYVVDYLATPWWPTFNLADAFVVVGVAILMVITLSTKQDASPVPSQTAGGSSS